MLGAGVRQDLMVAKVWWLLSARVDGAYLVAPSYLDHGLRKVRFKHSLIAVGAGKQWWLAECPV